MIEVYVALRGQVRIGPEEYLWIVATLRGENRHNRPRFVGTETECRAVADALNDLQSEQAWKQECERMGLSYEPLHLR